MGFRFYNQITQADEKYRKDFLQFLKHKWGRLSITKHEEKGYIVFEKQL